MLKELLLAGLILSAGVSLSSAGAAPNIHEGKWEITSTTEIEGMPGGGGTPIQYADCITSKDAVPQNPLTVKGCTTRDMKVEGNTITWTMRCTEQGATIEGSGTVTYSSDTMQGTVKLNLNDPEGGKMQMTQHLSGRRIGDCK